MSIDPFNPNINKHKDRAVHAYYDRCKNSIEEIGPLNKEQEMVREDVLEILKQELHD